MAVHSFYSFILLFSALCLNTLWHYWYVPIFAVIIFFLVEKFVHKATIMSCAVKKDKARNKLEYDYIPKNCMLLLLILLL